MYFIFIRISLWYFKANKSTRRGITWGKSKNYNPMRKTEFCMNKNLVAPHTHAHSILMTMPISPFTRDPETLERRCLRATGFPVIAGTRNPISFGNPTV